jgi:hypothetical protein
MAIPVTDRWSPSTVKISDNCYAGRTRKKKTETIISSGIVIYKKVKIYNYSACFWPVKDVTPNVLKFTLLLSR